MQYERQLKVNIMTAQLKTGGKEFQQNKKVTGVLYYLNEPQERAMFEVICTDKE